MGVLVRDARVIESTIVPRSVPVFPFCYYVFAAIFYFLFFVFLEDT